MNNCAVVATSLYAYFDYVCSVRTRYSTEYIFSLVFEIIANLRAFSKFYESTIETDCPTNTDLTVILINCTTFRAHYVTLLRQKHLSSLESTITESF